MDEQTRTIRLTADDDVYRTLMCRYQGGDPNAFEELYSALAPCVREYCRELVGIGPDESAVNEIFMGIHFARRTYSPRARFEPWLRDVVRHTLRPAAHVAPSVSRIAVARTW